MHEWLHWQAKTCVFCLLRLPLSNERRCGNGQGLSWHTPGLKGPQEDEGGDGLHKANSAIIFARFWEACEKLWPHITKKCDHILLGSGHFFGDKRVIGRDGRRNRDNGARTMPYRVYRTSKTIWGTSLTMHLQWPLSCTCTCSWPSFALCSCACSSVPVQPWASR